MSKITKSLAVFVLVACMASCQKKDNTPVDLSKVTVTFESPTAGHVYHTGDTVQINATVAYPAELAGIGVQIIDTAMDSVLFEDDQDTHTDHFSFQKKWIDDYPVAANLEVKIFVFVANNTKVPADRSIFISTQP